MNGRTLVYPNLAIALLNPNLERQPDKIAYIDDDGEISFRQLAEGVYRFASLLQAKGIGRGDRVLLSLVDSSVFIAAFLGTALVGGIAVAVSTGLARQQYQYIVDDCQARLALLSPSVVDGGFPVDKVPSLVCGTRLSQFLLEYSTAEVQQAAVQGEDLAYMLYTSGSTGTPKGVPHRHGDLLAAAEHYAVKVLGMGADDRIFSASKLYFGYGLGNSLAFPLYVGATTVLYSGPPSPDRLLALMENQRPTLFFSVPTVYAQLIRSVDEEHLSLPMRLCISAGELLPAAVLEEWQRLTGLPILDGIGSTEMTHIFISNRPGHIVPGSVGQVVPGYEVRLVDDAGTPVPTGKIGHLLVRGPGAALYYWRQPEKTTETMLPDGFMRTGDVFVEQDGCYFHKGRSDDMLKVAGQWISPIQVEEVLRTHPAVIDCAVASCRVGGLERPAAHLLLQPDTPRGIPLEKQLRRLVSDCLPDYMCPVLYHYVDTLPRTPTGKVQRFKLKQ